MAGIGTDLDPTLPQDQSSPESVAIATTLEATTAFTISGKVVRTGLPDLDRPLQVGDVVGDRYEIRRKLGHGGCGYVYAVFDRELEVTVALKTLRPDLRLAPEAVAQLKREIQLARRVTHKNICRIFDVGFHDDDGRTVPFLTMEMIAGPSLADRLLDGGALPVEDLEPLARQLVAGLDAAHRAGVVHADLKPGNIMLDEGGDEVRVVITDFGLATAQAIDLNPEGYVLGTPAYMAPEQVEGKPLSPATDYYALGCTLYHAATGDVPFREKGPYATAYARLERDPPPPSERAEVPAVWSEIIMGLLAREPAARIDGERMLEVLDPPRSRLGAISALVATAAVAIVVAALLWSGRSSTPPPAPLELSMPESAEAAAALAEAEEMLATAASSARPKLERVLELAPDHPRAHAAMAAAYDMTHPKKARGYYKRAAELARSRGADEHAYYQALYLMDEGRIGEANALLTELDVRHPGTFPIELALGKVQHKSGAADLAATTYAELEPRTEGEALKVLWIRASLEVELRHFDAGRRLAEQLISEARKARRPSAEARAEILLAHALKQLNDLESSSIHAKRGLEAAHRSGSPWLIAEAHSNMVGLLMARHGYTEALVSVNGREAALEQIGLEHEIVKLRITRAEILLETGRTAEALAVLDEQAIPRLRRKGAVYWEGYALLVRAQIRREMGEVSRALDDCHASHAIYRGIGNERLAAYADTICANALIDKGDLEAAREALDSAIATREKLELAALVAQNWIDRGELALAAGDADQAAVEADRAARFFEKTKPVPNDEATALELAARARWRAGDRSGARAAISRAQAVVEGESAPLENAIAITRLVIDPSPDADERMAQRIARLEKDGYKILALDAQIARAVIARAAGDEARARELETAARAAASERGLALYRYAPAK